MPRKDIWRQPSPTTITAVGCQPLIISTGTVVINNTKTITLDADNPVTYTPYCPYGVLPVRVFRNPSLLEMGDYGIERIPMETNDAMLPHSTSSSKLPFPEWQSPFYTSTIPATVAIGASTTVAWTLTLALLCSPRRPWLMKILTLIASICMTILSAVFFHYIRQEYNDGYIDGYLIVDTIEASTLEAVAVMICKFALLLAELRTLMRLFPRKREQRLILFSGALLICVDRVLWAVSEFSPSAPEERTDSVDAIIVFAYLFSIATAIVYAGAILLYSWWKWRIAYKPNLLVIAILSHISTFLPIALFVLDLADQYLDSWSTYAKLVSLMCASVCVWVWVDRIEDYEKTLELHSVLGRQQYTEDHSPFDFATGGGGMDNKQQQTMNKKQLKKSARHVSKDSLNSNTSGSSSDDYSKKRLTPSLSSQRNSKTDEESLPIHHTRTNSASITTPSSTPKQPRHWNSRLLSLLKFNILNRPGTSSSMQTTYIVSSTDQLGNPSDIIPLEQFNNYSTEGPMAIHKHPFNKQPPNNGDEASSISTSSH